MGFVFGFRASSVSLRWEFERVVWVGYLLVYFMGKKGKEV